MRASFWRVLYRVTRAGWAYRRWARAYCRSNEIHVWDERLSQMRAARPGELHDPCCKCGQCPDPWDLQHREES